MFSIKDSTRVFVCPTDTIYGISARVSDRDAIDRIREIKGGEEYQDFITLIADISDLAKFSIELTTRQKEFLARIWPGAVTVILDCEDAENKAFRVPDYPELREFIKIVGPIVSTSANKRGKRPAKTIKEIREIFGSKLDEYIDIGKLENEPSTIVKILR